VDSSSESRVSKDLRLRNVQPASEDDVIHELRRVLSTTSTVFFELRRGNLCLHGAHLALELLLHVQQACRRRIQELESERAAGLQIAITPQGKV
jgi:hypothetical protein